MGKIHKQQKEINTQWWKDHNEKLDTFLKADSSLEFVDAPLMGDVVVTPYEVNNQIMEERVNIINEFISPAPLKIIEVGGGYGNFARIYSKQHSHAEFTMLDNVAMHKFSKVFLHSHSITARFVNPDNFLNIKGKYDLLVAFGSLSETQDEYRERVLDHLLPQCRCVIFGETDKEYSKWVRPYLNKYFNDSTFVVPSKERPTKPKCLRMHVYGGIEKNE